MPEDLDELRKENGLDPFKSEDEVINGPKKPEEKSEDELEEEEKSEPEGEEEEEDLEDDEVPAGKTVPVQLFNTTRKEKRELARKVEELENQITGLTKRPEAKSDDELLSLAKESIPPRDEKKETEEQYNARVSGTVNWFKKVGTVLNKGSNISPELASQLDDLQQTQSFNKEWKGVQSSVFEENPNMSAKQLEDYKDALDQLSHAPQFADKELSYVIYKNKDIFDEILKSPVRKSFEAKDRRAGEGEDETIDSKTYNPGKAPIEKKLKVYDQMIREARGSEMTAMHNGEAVEIE